MIHKLPYLTLSLKLTQAGSTLHLGLQEYTLSVKVMNKSTCHLMRTPSQVPSQLNAHPFFPNRVSLINALCIILKSGYLILYPNHFIEVEDLGKPTASISTQRLMLGLKLRGKWI